MVKGNEALKVIGVQHLATANDLTVRVRIYLADAKGQVFSFEADSNLWDLHKMGIKDCPEMHKILGVAR
jgi:hypothetical protein